MQFSLAPWRRHVGSLLTSLAVCGLVVLFAAPALAQTSGSPTGRIIEAARPDEGRQVGDLQVHIQGNRAILDSVLLWIMDLPRQGPADEAIRQRAERRLRSFFAQTGYELARVRALVHDGELYVFVDEGKLDKVFFTGVGAGQALRLQLDMKLPGGVYNRQRVQEELARLEKEYDISDLHAELVVLEPKPKTVIQLQDFISALDAEDGAEDVWRESRGRYALRVHVESDGWGHQWAYGARYLLPYGLEPYAGYSSTGLFFADDRYRARLSVSGLRDKLFTQARADLYWAAPPFDDDWLRPAGNVRGRLENFERASLGLQGYYEFQLDGVASIGIEPLNHLVFEAGLGYGYENIFDLQTTPSTPDYVEPGTRSYPLGRLRLDWKMDTRGYRHDKYDWLRAEFEMYNVAAGMVRRAELRYQHVWEFGYQDLFWRLRGTSVTGAGAQWQDEEPIASSIVRAVAGPESFARNMGQAGLEFRLSLYRDILKVSASGGAAVVGLTDRDDRSQQLAFFASAGPGVHWLFLDNFQADLYYSFGWRDNAPTTGKFSFALAKVF